MGRISTICEFLAKKKISTRTERANSSLITELRELMCMDVWSGVNPVATFSEESQTPEGEAFENDIPSRRCGEFKGDEKIRLSKEELTFDNVHLAQRNYK